MRINDALAHLFKDTAYAEPGVGDGTGGWVASGAVIAFKCRIEGSVVAVTDTATGRRQVSQLQLITCEPLGLSAVTHRFTIPDRYTPYYQLRAHAIEKESDDIGPCYEIVYLP